jgi:hypothetical protein
MSRASGTSNRADERAWRYLTETDIGFSFCTLKVS